IVMGNAATYTGTGLEATYATDDTTALQAWMNDSSKKTRYLPAGIYGLTGTLLFGAEYSVHCDDAATLKVVAQVATPVGWPGAARTVPTAVYTSHTTLKRQGTGWRGGTIDCSLLCDDGFAPKYLRGFNVENLVVRMASARSFSFGDPATTQSSYEFTASHIRAWRDMGVVPVSGTSLDS